MVNFDELKRTLTIRLFEIAAGPHAKSQLTGREISYLLHDLTGHAIAGQVRNELLQNGLLRQTRAISDEEEGEYEITPDLIREIESSQASISSNTGEPKFSEFRDSLIVALYEKSNEEGLNAYKLKKLADERKMIYRDGWIIEVSNFLGSHEYALVRKSMRGDDTAIAKLNANGLEYAEEIIAEAESEENAPDVEPLFEIAGSGDTVTGGDGVPIISVPASDRIVSRTDNQGAWEEAAKSLDAVIAEYKKDHPRDNEIGSEKTALLGVLIAGRKLFDDTRINVEVGVALLMEPLKLIVRRYERELIGGLAATAFAAIAKLFGIL